MSSEVRTAGPVRPARLPWIKARDVPPSCPGCGRPVALSQPDSREPRQLLGACENDACAEWVVFTQIGRRWVVAGTISAEDRRNPRWTPARPAAPETARRGAGP